MNEIARTPPVGHPIGAYVPMVDGPEKVSGRAKYTADVLQPGMLAGRIYRSPYAHAEILSVDISEAARLPGVLAVITGADCDKAFGVLPIARNEYPLARGKVRYKGERSLDLKWVAGVSPAAGLAYPNPIGVANGARHPNAAKLFIHFALGEEGYAPYMEYGTWAARTDIALHPEMVPLPQSGFWFVDPEFNFRERKAVQDFIMQHK